MAEYRLVIEWELQADDLRQTAIHIVANEAADEGAAEALLDAWWAALDQFYHPDLSLVGYRWYEGVTYNGGSKQWGDPFRLTPRSLPGTAPQPANDQLPPQLAVVISFPMDLQFRRHRGRSYMPAPTTGSLSDDGRFLNYEEFADAWEDLLNGLRGLGMNPVVHASVNGLPAWLSIYPIRVDNVFDTQRRRGYEEYTAIAARQLAQILLELGLALVGAAGSVLTAYVARVALQTRTQTNGRLDELQARLALLEEVLAYSRGDRTEPGSPDGNARS